MAKDEKSLTTKVASGTPYQLNPEQVNKAATALVKHIQTHAKAKEEKTGKKNLLADQDASEGEGEEKEVPVYLVLGTKKHIEDQNRLKPAKIARAYKNLIVDPSFPPTLSAQITRVIGLSKLRAKYKTFETRRQLLAEYDIFLADDRIAPALPKTLGKIFFGGGKAKRPIPVNLLAGAEKGKKGEEKQTRKKEKEVKIGTPMGVAREIETALSAAYVHLSPSATSSIRIGKASMTPTQLAENAQAVVAKLVEKFVPKGWRGIRSLHIKGPSTAALPIWLADELWADEADVLEEKWKPPVKEPKDKAEKKRKWEEWEEDLLDEETLAERQEKRKLRKRKQVKEGEEQREKKEAAKRERRKLKEGALRSIQAPPIVG